MTSTCSLRELHTRYKKEHDFYKSKLRLCITDMCQRRLTYLRWGNWLAHLMLVLVWLNVVGRMLYLTTSYQYRLCIIALSLVAGYALLVILPRVVQQRLSAEFSGQTPRLIVLDSVVYGEWDLLRIVLLPVHFVSTLELREVDVSNGISDFMNTRMAQARDYASTMKWQAVIYCITLSTTDLCLSRIIGAHLSK